MCAGIYAGFFKDFEDAVKVCQRITGQTEPDQNNRQKYEKAFAKYKKISKFLVELSDEK